MPENKSTRSTHWRQRIIPVGTRFGRWTVIDGPFLRPSPSRNRPDCLISYWLCRCECGTEREVRASSLCQGKGRSCGCWGRELCSAMSVKHSTKHGGTVRSHPHPEYHIWQSLRGRCQNPRDKGYHRYGGRGITVCDRWDRDYTAFFADMGSRPSPRHSIDRIDNNGGYWCGRKECGDCGPLGRKPNCRWATPKEQSSNLRNNVYLEHDGKRFTQSEWARITGLNYTTITYRLRIGCSVADALTRPTKYNRKAGYERPRSSQEDGPPESQAARLEIGDYPDHGGTLL